MSGEEVVSILGKPSREIVDSKTVSGLFGGNHDCSRTSKILVYDKWLRDDVIVGVDAQAKVTCTESLELIDMKVVHTAP